MDRKGLFIFFVLFSSFLLIPISLIKGDTIYYVHHTYQINESKDDAVYYINLDYSDDEDFLLVKSNLYDTKTGFVFNNISILDNATFTYVYLSLYSNDSYTDNNNYWVTLYGIDEDNSSSFSDFEDFNSRSYTTKNINWNLEDLEGLDTWVNSTDLSSIFNEVKSRSGWSSGNNIGLYIISTKSNDAYRMCTSYDGNSTYAPKLYIQYRYIVKEQEDCEYVETYDGYYIYTCGGDGSGDLDWELNTAYDVSDVNVDEYNDYYVVHRLLWFSENLNRFIWFGEYNDEVHYFTSNNGTSGWDNYNLNVGLVGLQGWDIDSYLYEDETGVYCYVLYSHFTNDFDLYMYMIEINNDGSFTPVSGSPQVVHSIAVGEKHRYWSCTVDTSGYLWALWYDYDTFDTRVTKNSVKDGSWSTAMGFPYISGVKSKPDIIALDNNEIVITGYETNGGYIMYLQLYDGSWSPVRTKDLTASSPMSSMYRLSKFSDNDVMIVWEDTGAGNDIWSLKWEYDNESWLDVNLVYDNPFSATSSRPELSIDENDVAWVFWAPNANSPTLDYVVYSNSTDKGESWCGAYSWIDQSIGAIDKTPITPETTVQGFIPVGWLYDVETDILRIAYLGDVPVGEYHYFIYDEDGELVISCFTDIEDVYDWIDEESQKYESYQDLGNTISWMLGLLGLIMMPLGFVLFVSQAQSGDYRNAFLYLMICFFIGMSLFVGWLWG